MTDTETKIKTISSLAAPTSEDMKIWNALSDEERLAIIQARADEAAASKHRYVSAEDIIRSAQAKLKNG
jgi:predicted Fe-S protein YdhL (DUF1289 family)